jgi:predicted RNA-binding Zn-ribbon protein involved in translation (DUF1610 family)
MNEYNSPDKEALEFIKKCLDCDADIKIRQDTEKGEIYSCPGCGLELEVKRIEYGENKRIKDVDLQELTIEDWGE